MPLQMPTTLTARKRRAWLHSQSSSTRLLCRLLGVSSFSSTPWLALYLQTLKRGSVLVETCGRGGQQEGKEDGQSTT